MKALICVLFAFTLSAQLSTPQKALQTEDSQLFVLDDPNQKEWCIYANEASWKSDVESKGAATVASLVMNHGHLRSINLTQEDEAGDWMVFDHYVIDDRGELVQDQRKINIIPGDRSVEENYFIRDGVAAKKTSITRSLRTGKPKIGGEDWVPDVTVFTRLKDLPFARLIEVEGSEILAKGKVCTPSGQS